jgi:Cu2+-exporting ATPase
VQEIAGEGVQGLDDEGRTWRLGSARFVGAAQQDEPVDAASVWFGRTGQALLRFDFDEALRPDGAATVAALRADGLRVTLLSGDRAERAEEVGRKLGVDAAIGAATPQAKLQVVQSLQHQGRRVLMVGDGLNDAPVLARSDVSIAFGQSALLARARCDAVVTSNRVADVLHSRAMAVATMRVVRQNLTWAAVYNALCIPLALVGWLPPWAAGLGMASSSLLVVLNSRRLAH